MIRVSIVEDDTIIRKMTASLLNSNPDIECVEVFADAEAYLQQADKLHADVVLMDIGLPGMSGIECIRRCSTEDNTVNFLIYSDHLDSVDIFDALAAGANGYVLKGQPIEKLADAIRDVQAGSSPMSSEISRMVTSYFRRTQSLHPDFEKLTTQEWEVLRGLEKGLTYKEIGNNRFVSENTVRTQVRSIYEKLHVHNRTDALNRLMKGK